MAGASDTEDERQKSLNTIDDNLINHLQIIYNHAIRESAAIIAKNDRIIFIPSQFIIPQTIIDNYTIMASDTDYKVDICYEHDYESDYYDPEMSGIYFSQYDKFKCPTYFILKKYSEDFFKICNYLGTMKIDDLEHRMEGRFMCYRYNQKMKICIPNKIYKRVMEPS